MNALATALPQPPASRPDVRVRPALRGAIGVVGLGLLFLGRGGWLPLVDAAVPLWTEPFLLTVVGVVALAIAAPGCPVRLLRGWVGDDRRTLWVLLTAYLVAWGGLLASATARYWDDWTISEVPADAVIGGFTEFGSPWFGYLHVALLEVGPWLYRVLTFLLMGLVGLLGWAIAARVGWLTRGERVLLVTLLLVLPLNSARHALINLPYTVSYAAFAGAWYLLVRDRELRHRTGLAATGLLVVAYTTQSLLVFVALPVLHLLCRELPPAAWTIPSLARWTGRRWYLLASPLTFFAVKSAFFSPFGAYEGYNQVTLPLLAREAVWVLGAVALLLAVLLGRERLPVRLRHGAPVVAGGVAAVTLGAFPYRAVGHVPGFTEWASRHQLLLSLGVALTLIGLVRIVTATAGRGAAVRSAVALVALSVLYSLHLSVSFLVDWRKQIEVVEQLATSTVVEDATTIVYRDRVLAQNANGRTYRPYEINAFLAEATGEERRAAARPRNVWAVDRWEELTFDNSPRYRATGHEVDPDRFALVDITGSGGPMLWQALRPGEVRIEAEPTTFDDLLDPSP